MESPPPPERAGTVVRGLVWDHIHAWKLSGGALLSCARLSLLDGGEGHQQTRETWKQLSLDVENCQSAAHTHKSASQAARLEGLNTWKHASSLRC